MKAGRQLHKLQTEAQVIDGMRNEVTGAYQAIENAIDTKAAAEGMDMSTGGRKQVINKPERNDGTFRVRNANR